MTAYHDDAGHIIGPYPSYGSIRIDCSDVRPPFAIRHVRVLYGSEQIEPERQSNVRQLAHCIAGTCTLTVDGVAYWLDSPVQGLSIGADQRRELSDLSADCILSFTRIDRLTLQGPSKLSRTERTHLTTAMHDRGRPCSAARGVLGNALCAKKAGCLHCWSNFVRGLRSSDLLFG